MASVREMLCHLWKSMVVLITSMKQLKGTRTWLSNVAVITNEVQNQANAQYLFSVYGSVFYIAVA